MKILERIVDTINDKLMDGVLHEQAFQRSSIYGLSYLSVPKTDAPQRPYTFDRDNVISIDVSDSDDFSIYHRCFNISFKDAPSYGDGNGMVLMTAEMYAITYCNRSRSGYSQEDLIMKISAGLNGQFSKSDLGNSKLQKVKVSVQRANNNTAQVFSGEYGSGANCPFQLETVYFGINYQIEIIVHSDCLQCAEC